MQLDSLRCQLLEYGPRAFVLTVSLVFGDRGHCALGHFVFGHRISHRLFRGIRRNFEHEKSRQNGACVLRLQALKPKVEANQHSPGIPLTRC